MHTVHTDAVCVQVPVAIPPGMDPGMAKSMIEYLRSNPEAAKATYDEAQRLLQVQNTDQYIVSLVLLPFCAARQATAVSVMNAFWLQQQRKRNIHSS